LSSRVKLTANEMHYISLFESITGAIVQDCIIDNDSDRVIFVVKPGMIGLAIGKNGVNIRRAKKFLGKSIDVVEYADTPELFIKNTLVPVPAAKVRSVTITERLDGRKIASVEVDPEYRGIAIGKNGRNIARARILAKRHFGIDDVKIK